MTVDIAKNSIYTILHLLLVSVIKFYNLDLMGQEMWKDLLLNALTNMVLRKNIYILYYTLTQKSLAKNLEIISKNMDTLKNISPRQLGISDLLGWISKDKDKICWPYFNTVRKLRRIRDVESPIKKMEIAFRLFTETLTKEIDDYWKDDFSVSNHDLALDADSLKAIMIYIIIKSQCHTLLVDIVMWEDFTTENVKYTNRAYYMTVLHSAYEFLELVKQDQIDEMVEDTKDHMVELEEYMEIRMGREFAQSMSSDQLGYSSQWETGEGQFEQSTPDIDKGALIPTGNLELHLDFISSGMRKKASAPVEAHDINKIR
jgi:hypothetical protein